MKTILTLLLMLSINCPQAQVTEKKADQAKQKAGQKANARVDRRVDQGLDKGLDAIEGLFKRKKKTTGKADDATETKDNVDQRNTLMGLFGNNANAKHQEVYTFNSQMSGNLTTTNKRGKEEKMKLDYFLQPNGQQIGMSLEPEKDKGQSAFTIFDMENLVMIVIAKSTSQPIAMIIPLDNENFTNYDQDDEPDPVKFTKTGKTKAILGYTCQEYKFTANGYTGNSWVSDELPQFRQNFMSILQKAQKDRDAEIPANFPEGTLLEMHMAQNTGESTHWVVTGLKENAKLSMPMSDYQIIAMPASGAGKN